MREYRPRGVLARVRSGEVYFDPDMARTDPDEFFTIYTVKERGKQMDELKARFRAACEATRKRYGLSEDECAELWGTEETA